MHAPYHHLSVLAKEALQYLDPKPGSTIVDTTAGAGGHLRLIAQAIMPSGLAIGLDKDPRAHLPDAALGVLQEFPNTKLIKRPFSEVKEALEELKIEGVDGLLCDLGVSSPQLDDASRGFSFLKEGPLDMRMDTASGITAYELLKITREEDLANLIYEYGEERFSRRIAKSIKQNLSNLPNSTLALAELIRKTVGKREKIHPATRTFQALRIAVNQELDELKTLLEQLPKIMKKEGVAVFISFHSLEDRIIKHTFKDLKHTKEWEILTKKPVCPSLEEQTYNKRSRSAKLRAIRRI